MRPQPYSFLLKSVVSGEFSDFSLTCNDHDFKLHQVVVCPQSPVIKAALLGGFKETTSKVVAVNEFDVTAVRSMVTFLYTGDYDPRTDKLQMPLQSDDDVKNEEAEIHDSQGDSMSEDSEASGPERERTTEDILFHLRVNAIADYYKIEKLVKLSTTKIGTIFEIDQDFRIFPTVIQEMSVSNRETDLESIIASAMANCVEELTASQRLPTLDLENSLAIGIIEACDAAIAAKNLGATLRHQGPILIRELLTFSVAKPVTVAIHNLIPGGSIIAMAYRMKTIPLRIMGSPTPDDPHGNMPFL
ncbi:speckle-type POZ [Fusarium subglutinans]|uniref:Speckle-type POZ n=1 Tax=Gibberella subglutinans TaxID=42677 RepID=A0A8H5KWR4_GIBSU|nr:speckle-type POZ [Fusarium subglutinans]KAF5580594.1 speckle-type POZ [Fusarium subglutinans]